MVTMKTMPVGSFNRYFQPLQSKSRVLVERTSRFVEGSRVLCARVERAFAAFAKVPYHDALTQLELELLFVELDESTRIVTAPPRGVTYDDHDLI